MRAKKIQHTLRKDTIVQDVRESEGCPEIRATGAGEGVDWSSGQHCCWLTHRLQPRPLHAGNMSTSVLLGGSAAL